MIQQGDSQKFYLGYLTANDDPSFLMDYLNIKNMVRYDPGVSFIHVCISVSKVNELDDTDRDRIKQLKLALLGARHISEVHVIIKDNIGRDFSSAQKCLEYFSQFSSDDDYIMIRNRSGYGPFEKDWYLEYIMQNQKMPGGGLTGSTINQRGLKNIETNGIPTHVQTYVYLSQWRHFKPILNDFPGKSSKNKREVILKGELELSSSFLERGLSLNSLEWNDYIFTLQNNFYSELPVTDIKNRTATVPIRFRYRRYIYRFWSIIDGLRWDSKELFKEIFIKRINWMINKNRGTEGQRKGEDFFN